MTLYAPFRFSSRLGNSCYQDVFIQFLLSLDDVFDGKDFEKDLKNLKNKEDPTPKEAKFATILGEVGTMIKELKEKVPNQDILKSSTDLIDGKYKEKAGVQDDMRWEMQDFATVVGDNELASISRFMANDFKATVKCPTCGRIYKIEGGDTKDPNLIAPDAILQIVDIDQSVLCTFRAWIGNKEKLFTAIPIKLTMESFLEYHVSEIKDCWAVLLFANSVVTRVYTKITHPYLCIADLDMSRNIMICQYKNRMTPLLVRLGAAPSYGFEHLEFFKDEVKGKEVEFYDPSIDQTVKIQTGHIQWSRIPPECFPIKSKKSGDGVYFDLPDTKGKWAGSMAKFSPEADLRYHVSTFQRRPAIARPCQDHECNELEMFIKKEFTSKVPSRYLTFVYAQGMDSWEDLAPEHLTLYRNGKGVLYDLHFIGAYSGSVSEGNSGHWSCAVRHKDNNWHSTFAGSFSTNLTYQQVINDRGSHVRMVVFKRKKL